MWLKILSPSPRSTKDNRQAPDADPNAVSKDRLHKQTKVKALVKNGKTKALKMKQGSSKLLVTAKQQLQSRLAEQPNEREDNEADLQPIKTNSASTDGSTPSSADEGFTRRYWVHSATPPHKTSRPKGPEELLWNDLDSSAWPDLGSKPNQPKLTPKVSEPLQNDPELTPNSPDPILQQQQQQKHFPCDVSVLTDDLNSVVVQHGQPIISLEDVKIASKAALFNALWCGGIVVEAGKTAGVAIYKKSVQVDGMPCVSTSPNDVEAAALETTSTTTHTTSGSSISSSNKSPQQQQKQGPHDEHKAVIEKRLTQKAKNARRSRRNRLVSQNNKKSQSQPKRTARFRNREDSSKKEAPPTKDLVVVDEESTIFIEEGDDCFLMTKDDYDDLVDTFQSLMGNEGKGSTLSKEQGGLCDCHIAKDVVDWFMGTPKSSSSQGTSREHAAFVNQAATTLMWKDPEQFWKTIMDHDNVSSAAAPSATAATSFVADDMRGSQDTSDSNWSGRTPKIQNTHTKFEDKDMMILASTTPSLVSKSKTKAVPIHAPPPMQPILETVNSIIEKDHNEEDSLEEEPSTTEVDHEFQPTDTIRTDDLVVAYGGETGQSEDTIETVLVSDEKEYGSDNRGMVLEQVDTEYGDGYVSSDSEDEDDSIFSVPIDEATDATQYANGFMFDTNEKKYDWDYGHYKVNSRDASKMPTILEVDIGTIVVVQNNGDDEEDGFSHDLSSITPDTMDYSIETLSTAGGGAISPVRPPTMMHKVKNANQHARDRKVEIGRRLEELEAELSQLQSSDTCHTVGSNLTSPPASQTGWGTMCDHHAGGGVEEHKEGFDVEDYDEEGVMSI